MLQAARALVAYFAAFVFYGAFLIGFMPTRMPERSYAYNLVAWTVVVGLYAASILMGWWWATVRSEESRAETLHERKV